MAAKTVSVDEGGVFKDAPTSADGEYKGPVEGEDRAGVYDPTPGKKPVVEDGKEIIYEDTGVDLVKKPKTTLSAMTVFTNTRFPSQTIAIVTDRGDGTKERTGYYVDFQSTKLMTSDPERVEQIEALGRPYIFREPIEFIDLPPDSEKFYRHRDTGFKTLVKAAYEDWVDNSEWAAKPK